MIGWLLPDAFQVSKPPCTPPNTHQTVNKYLVKDRYLSSVEPEPDGSVRCRPVFHRVVHRDQTEAQVRWTDRSEWRRQPSPSYMEWGSPGTATDTLRSNGGYRRVPTSEVLSANSSTRSGSSDPPNIRANCTFSPTRELSFCKNRYIDGIMIRWRGERTASGGSRSRMLPKRLVTLCRIGEFSRISWNSAFCTRSRSWLSASDDDSDRPGESVTEQE